MVSIKYVFIVLAADDDGEGGTFALYSLLARYANIVEKDPNQSGTVKMERYITGELKPANMGVRNFIEKSGAARVTLKILGVVGVSMVIAYVEVTLNGNLLLIILQRWCSYSCSICLGSCARPQSSKCRHLNM